MVKNLSREFATMSDDERRRFAMEEEEGSREHPAELVFDEPRNEDNMGPQYSSIKQEVADPEHRDGMSALLDDEQHERAVREASGKQNQPESADD
ncbi:MAG TPA: hypothetical protein VD930_06160 [Gemmatimonadales bacterium]|nr:hypothetical protein [Gemmatimonadales bacterium]